MFSLLLRRDRLSYSLGSFFNTQFEKESYICSSTKHFEDRLFPVPLKWDTVLRAQYGEYHILPDLDKINAIQRCAADHVAESTVSVYSIKRGGKPPLIFLLFSVFFFLSQDFFKKLSGFFHGPVFFQTVKFTQQLFLLFGDPGGDFDLDLNQQVAFL